MKNDDQGNSAGSHGKGIPSRDSQTHGNGKTGALVGGGKKVGGVRFTHLGPREKNGGGGENTGEIRPGEIWWLIHGWGVSGTIPRHIIKRADHCPTRRRKKATRHDIGAGLTAKKKETCNTGGG